MGCTSSTPVNAAATSSPVKSGAARDDDDDKKIPSTAPTSSTTNHTNNNNFPPVETSPDPPSNATTATATKEKDPLCNEVRTPTKTTFLGNGVKVRYACYSRRGRDPDAPTKPNQDSYGAHEDLCGDVSFFGVYDGHGPQGQECSQFVRDKLPALLKEKLERKNNHNTPLQQQFSNDQLRFILDSAHVECNQELHAASDINDSYSGTTSISVLVHASGTKITVSNVGDSRAILGTKIGPQLLTIPLSKDQTPKRPDEAARCVAKGARILSFGEIDDHKDNKDDDDDDSAEDPPRVWSKLGKFPGTAFTRSLGDAVAEKLGVFAEPEQLTLQLDAKVQYIVLATDGIFDVLENQQVIDLCHQHIHDPMKACEEIVCKSHQEWLLNEDCVDDEEHASYDDMTLICIFLNEAAAAATLPPPLTFANQQQQHHQQPTMREKRSRIRQKTLRNLEEMETAADVQQ